MTVYVRSDGVGSPDYTSLGAAITASETDIEIQGTWASADTTAQSISYACTITATGDAKHPGYVGSSPTHWRKRNTSGHSFTISANVTFDGLDIGNQSTGSSDECIRLDANSITATAKNCLLWFNSVNSEQDIFYINNKDNCSVLLENCIGWNAERAVVDIYAEYHNYDLSVDINACTFYNCVHSSGGRYGIVGSHTDGTNTINIFNSLLHQNDTTNGILRENSTGSFSATVDRCITNCSSIDEVTETDCTLSATFADTTGSSAVIFEETASGSEDFRLQSHANNIALDAHADSSGAGLTMPSTDLIGTTRPQNTNYDIGAFEYASAGGSYPIPMALNHYRRMRG